MLISTTARRTLANTFPHRLPASLVAMAILAGTALPPATADATPHRPTDDTQVLEQLPDPADDDRRALRRLRAGLSAEPEDLSMALNLARRYLAAGRSEADPRYLGYAEAVLGPWLDQPDPPTEVLVLRAVLHQSRHAFDAAIADLDRVLADRPDHPQALLSRAFVLQVQGRVSDAGESCRQLPAFVDGLVKTACLARVASLGGDATSALEDLAAELARSPAAAPSLRQWALTILAEIAVQLDMTSSAELHFRTALALHRRDAYLLAAYSDFLLDRGRYSEVRRLLADETRIDGLLLRLALAEKALGDDRHATHTATLAARFAASRRRGDLRHLREEARYVLQLVEDPAGALDLALENWRGQREPADARLVLEAASAADAPGRARDVLDWIDETGLKDAQLENLAVALRAEGA